MHRYGYAFSPPARTGRSVVSQARTHSTRIELELFKLKMPALQLHSMQSKIEIDNKTKLSHEETPLHFSLPPGLACTTMCFFYSFAHTVVVCTSKMKNTFDSKWLIQRKLSSSRENTATLWIVSKLNSCDGLWEIQMKKQQQHTGPCHLCLLSGAVSSSGLGLTALGTVLQCSVNYHDCQLRWKDCCDIYFPLQLCVLQPLLVDWWMHLYVCLMLQFQEACLCLNVIGTKRRVQFVWTLRS